MKRRLTIFITHTAIFAALLISSLGVVRPNVAHAAACTVTNGAFNPNPVPTYSTTVTINAGDTITVDASFGSPSSVSVTITPPGGAPVSSSGFQQAHAVATTTSSGSATIDIVAGTSSTSYYVFFTISVCSPGGSASHFTDGRCNLEADQSVAVYPDGSGGYNFYAIYNSVGYFALRLTKADLDSHPDKGENYLITQAKGAQVYRLAGGKLLVKRLKHDGKIYEFTWTSCG